MEKNNILICIGRQLGSGGHDIGRMLALDLGAKYYDRELLNLAAKESGFSERIFEQNDERKGFLKSLLNVQVPHIGGNTIYRQNFSQESLFQFQSDAIRKAAQQDSCVFVGRCADYVLRDQSRASYYNYYTGKKWGHAASYDLCIDSSVLGLSRTEKFIAEFIRKKFNL